MDNQIKFPFESFLATSNLWIFSIEKPIIPFSPYTPAHDNYYFHGKGYSELPFDVPFCCQL
jgi:hypothetical protein